MHNQNACNPDIRSKCLGTSPDFSPFNGKSKYTHSLPFLSFKKLLKVYRLSLERVLKALESLGLSRIDSQVYVYLATSGPKKAKDMINALTINKRQVYRSLTRLQNKGIALTNDERPFLFSAVPFEDVIDLLMEIIKEQAKALQASKEELVSDFRTKEKNSNSRS